MVVESGRWEEVAKIPLLVPSRDFVAVKLQWEAKAAAVRRAVILTESSTARGEPLMPSKSTTTPWMVGRPCRSGLPGKLALILAAK
jgi:hypothetical protein